MKVVNPVRWKRRKIEAFLLLMAISATFIVTAHGAASAPGAVIGLAASFIGLRTFLND